MSKNPPCWWLCSLLCITTSFYYLNAQSLDPFALVTEEEHPFFGGLQVYPNSTKVGLDSFQVFAQKPGNAKLPMLGQWQKQEDEYFFLPRFPFRQGKTYWVRWRTQDGELQLSTIEIPIRENIPAPALLAIYPSPDRWPANQLKFYIQFDQPMQEGVALQYIQLLDENGKEIEQPFLEIGQELWDEDYRQLTVWFDPGRIKTGLIPNEKFGPPLLADRIYQLRINAGFPSKVGKKLSQSILKTIHTIPKDQERPNPHEWTLQLPTVGTRGTFRVQFPEPLDFGPLQSGLWIEDAAGQVLDGDAAIGLEERSWSWTPTTSWRPSVYYLRIDPDLEDLAGNNLQRLFDTHLEGSQDKIQQLPTSLTFQVLERK
ncbi:MAG: hypothetical protein HRU41_28305 [Saprospiraceae bacterium]|nr:hypothetical protein [Saprospiraceae bacterium]